MRNRGVLTTACLAASLSLAAAQETAPREPRYLSFTARDRNKIYLRDLKLPEVSLFLDGQPAKVSYLGYKNVETALVFMLENSPRTAFYPVSMPQWGKVNRIDQIRYQLASDYFDPLVELGPVMLAEYYLEVKVLQDFTTESFQLEDAVNRMTPNFSGVEKENIIVGRAMATGVERLRKRQEKRKLMVFMTTTVDRESYRDLEEYKDLLRACDVDLYVISFAQRFPSGPGTTFEEKVNRLYFDTLIKETGGKLYLSSEYAFISEFTDDIKTRLANSYTIGFYVTPSAQPQEHTVRLLARNEKVEVAHRKKLLY